MGQPEYHLRCVDKFQDTIRAVIESINRNLKSAFGEILHCTMAEERDWPPAYCDLKLLESNI